MCKCDPVIRLNQEGIRLVKILKIFFFLYLVLIMAKVILKNFDGAISGIIAMLILLITFLQCYYLFAGYLIFFVIFNLFYSLVFIGLRIQNKVADIKDIYFDNGWYTAVIILEVVSFIFYILLIYYAFQSYKEFKACYLNGGGYSELSSADLERNNTQQQRGDNTGYVPFAGRGTTLGGD